MIEMLFLFTVIVFLIMALGNLVKQSIPLEDRLPAYADPTDASYLAKMPEGVSDEVALGVRRILVDVGGVEADEVWPETKLVELLD